MKANDWWFCAMTFDLCNQLWTGDWLLRPWFCCRIWSHKTLLRGHSRQWSTVYYTGGSKGNRFPARTPMISENLVLYPHPRMTGYTLVMSSTCRCRRINTYNMQMLALLLTYLRQPDLYFQSLSSLRKGFSGFSLTMVNKVQAQFTSCLKTADSFKMEYLLPSSQWPQQFHNFDDKGPYS